MSQIFAIHYGRVSTDTQEMDRQNVSLEHYSERMQFEILTRLADPDVSGSVPFAEREAGAELLTHLRRFPNLQIITTEQDRIGRDTVDQIQTIRAFWKAGATPHFVLEGGALPRTDENEYRMETRASQAQYERNKIRSRIRSKFVAKRAQGELCGTVTFGWHVRYTFRDGHQIVRSNAFSRREREAEEHLHHGLLSSKPEDNAEEQKWLRFMLDCRAQGWTDWQIANELNRLGVKTKRAGTELSVRCARDGSDEASDHRVVSGYWQQQQVKKLLASKTVLDWAVANSIQTGIDAPLQILNAPA